MERTREGREKGVRRKKLSHVEVPLVLVPLFTRHWEGAMVLTSPSLIHIADQVGESQVGESQVRESQERREQRDRRHIDCVAL